MSQQLVNIAGCVCRWPIWDGFSGSLSGKFIEGIFSLTFPQSGKSASLRWTGLSVRTEVNLVVNVKIEGQSGQILTESWRVNNLKNNDVAVELIYRGRIDNWASWTVVEVEFADFTPIRLSEEAARSYWIIRNDRDFQRLSCISAATSELAVHSGLQLNPIKPVVKAEQIGQTEDQLRPKSSSSGVDSEPIGQPPVKRQKIAPRPTAKIGVNSAVKFVGVPVPTAMTPILSQLLSSGYRMSTDNHQRNQTVTTELSQLNQLREENLRLTSKLTETQQQLAQLDAEAKLKLTEKSAELTQLQLTCDRFKMLSETQAASITNLEFQLSMNSAEIEEISCELKLKSESVEKLIEESKVKSESIVELTDELKIKSKEIENLQTEVASKAEQLQKGRESVKSHQSEIANVCETNANLEAKLIDLQTLLDRKSAELNKLTSELTDQRLMNDRNLGEIQRQSIVIDEKTKMEENLRAQLAQMKKFFEEEMSKQLSFDTLPFTIRLANQLRSNLLMTKTFEFGKREKGNKQMWEDLRDSIGNDLPDIFAQMCVFSDIGEDANFPKFHFSAETNPT